MFSADLWPVSHIRDSFNTEIIRDIWRCDLFSGESQLRIVAWQARWWWLWIIKRVIQVITGQDYNWMTLLQIYGVQSSGSALNNNKYNYYLLFIISIIISRLLNVEFQTVQCEGHWYLVLWYLVNTNMKPTSRWMICWNIFQSLGSSSSNQLEKGRSGI